MTPNHPTALSPGASASRNRAPWVLLLALTGAGVAALALLDRAPATSSDSLRRLTFGRPVGWLVQDQSPLDPPTFPRRQTMASPWEHPTRVDALPLLLDVLLVLVLLVALWRTTTWLAARRAGPLE